MMMPLFDFDFTLVRGVRHEFLRLQAPGRSGFKTVSVAPLDEDTCGMVIDLDGENTERSIVRVRVENKDGFRIAKFVSGQPLVDIIAAKENKKDDETQH